MLSERNKVIILLVGAVVIIGLIVAAVFGVFSKKAAPLTPEQAALEELKNTDLSFLENPGSVKDTVFDSSNAGQLGDQGEVDKISPLEREARALAAFFTERFGTYSSDSSGAQFDDIRAFMTGNMRAWADNFRAEEPQREGYYAVQTETALIDTKEFSPAKRRAGFDLMVNRSETAGRETENYRQKVSLELVQNSQGQWLVNSLYWGERL